MCHLIPAGTNLNTTSAQQDLQATLTALQLGINIGSATQVRAAVRERHSATVAPGVMHSFRGAQHSSLGLQPWAQAQIELRLLLFP